jgi:mono/diheme cytochrome c family protein
MSHTFRERQIRKPPQPLHVEADAALPVCEDCLHGGRLPSRAPTASAFANTALAKSKFAGTVRLDSQNMRAIPFAILLISAVAAHSAESQGDTFFREKVQPILSKSCFKCHSHGEKMKANLLVDSREALLTGGDTGPAIVPGDPAKSLLIEAVAYTNKDLQMPPKGEKLTDAQIATLTQWVKLGAPWPEEPGQKMKSRPRGTITDADRQWWAFKPVAKVEPPPSAEKWGSNEIDRFIFEKLGAAKLRPAPAAERTALIRRVYFDLTGLPPTPEEAAAFAADKSPDAYAKLVDKLLASPRYGEQWARHWLDLVRYAESDGYRADDYRPNAWRYRDYVVASFNGDKPYDRFVQEQLAGDELWPDSPEARIATGYLTLGIYEYNNRDAAGQWTTMLNDITDTTADVFMGMGVQCARCHDHKFDPILQKDYYRLQAFFAPIRLIEETEVATKEQRKAYDEKFAVWGAKTAALREKIEAIEAPIRAHSEKEAVKKFPPETRAIIAKPREQRTPYEEQIVELAWRQVSYEYQDKRFEAHVKGNAKTHRNALLAELNKFRAEKPEPLPRAPIATDVGPEASPVFIPKKKAVGEIAPGFLTALDELPAKITPLPNSTGRRSALAHWLTQPENPLTARVIVNRVWQYHFGHGLAVNASDFGTLGEKPSHPELLDWLARWFVDNGWSIKKLHRLIVTSATYAQSATNPIAAQAKLADPENRLLWHMPTRRLDAEQIRDAMLAVTGELEFPEGGPALELSHPVRSIYSKLRRNSRDPVLEVFDQPERFSSASQRNVTTTPTQSLLMINGKWTLERARAFAARLRKENSSEEREILTDAFRLCFGRDPSASLLDAAHNFIEQQAKEISGAVDSEAATFVSEKMQTREGLAAQLTPFTSQERLTVPHDSALPRGNFTVEAFINVWSVYPSGAVRTIVSKWDGEKGHPGWSLGVTGMGSRNKPQTLVLQLSGDKPGVPAEAVFSGLHIDIGKPYFVAVSVDLANTAESGITFYIKDLTNDDEPMQSVQIAHTTTGGITNEAPLVFGGMASGEGNLFDGLVDDVRLSDAPLRAEELLFTSPSPGEHTMGYWKFDATPNPYADSSGHGHDISIARQTDQKKDPRLAALVDFCHILLNSNEFLYLD